MRAAVIAKRRPIRSNVVVVALLAVMPLGCGFHLNDPLGGGGNGSAPAQTYAGDATIGAGDDVSSPSCNVVPEGLQGAQPPGAPCQTAADCAVTCCDCGEGPTSWLAASCVEGICVDADVTCGRTRAAYCEAPPPPPPPPIEQCGGFTGATAACDACFQSSCCAEAAACAADATCATLEQCRGACTDAECAAQCDATYGASDVADALDACSASCGCE